MPKGRQAKRSRERVGSVTIRVRQRSVEVTNLQTPSSEKATYVVVIPERKAGRAVDMPEPVKKVLFDGAPLKTRQNPEILDQIEGQIKLNVLKKVSQAG